MDLSSKVYNTVSIYHLNIRVVVVGGGKWCLMPLSTIFQLYHGRVVAVHIILTMILANHGFIRTTVITINVTTNIHRIDRDK
jgi:hypothetical protein